MGQHGFPTRPDRWKALFVPAVIRLRLPDPGPVETPRRPVELRHPLESRLGFLVGTDIAKAGGQSGISASDPCERAVSGSFLLFVESEPEACAQSLRQHLDTESLIPSRRPQPGPSAREELSGD